MEALMSDDLRVNISDADAQFIKGISGNLQLWREELANLFPEREWVIRQIMLALLTGRNVLIFGTYGTAKSLLAATVFSSIVGPGINGETKQVFAKKIDGDTTKAEIIGPPNFAILRREGALVPMVEGYLPTAHFAFLDEFLDGPAVMRMLNDVLNEKELREGKTNLRVPLITAIATTNRGPGKIVQMYPSLDLDAVIDRFLFTARVDYLEQDSHIHQMLMNYVNGVYGRANSTIRFTDIQRLGQIIRDTNQFPSQTFLDVYVEVIQTYRRQLKQQSKKDISDRRLNELTQIVEAEAILHGRINLYLDDILAAGLGLADGPNSREYELFKQIAQPILEKAKKAFDEHVDDAVQLQLDQLEADLKALKRKVNPPSWPADAGAGAVGEALKSLGKIEGALQIMKPEINANDEWRKRLLGAVEDIRKTAVNRASS
jgi:MoxR-like ATPase